MKLLHLSDLHIGRRLGNIQLLDDQKHILMQAIKMAQECDVILLAGDIYDKAQPSSEAIRVVSNFFVSLSRLNKPVFVISGNHDSAEQIAYCHELLGQCGVFVSPAYDGELRPHVLHDEFGEIHIWLLPFIKPANVRKFYTDVRSYDDAVRFVLQNASIDLTVRNVLVAHQFVSGSEVCESESRLIGGLDQVGLNQFAAFDYVALGHLHSPQRLAGGRICYSGSPLKYSLSEANQKKGALIVKIEEKGALSVEAAPFEPLHDLRIVRGNLSSITKPDDYSTDYVYATVTDEQATLDPLGILRLTYPNLIGMRVENSRTNVDEANYAEVADAEAFSPLEHFIAFYQAQNNQTLPDEEKIAIMSEVIAEAEEMQNASD